MWYNELDMSQANQAFTWEAPEFRSYTKSFIWYLLLGFVVLLLIAYQIYTDDKFGAFTTFVLGVLAFVIFRQQPKSITISISKDGIGAGEHLYPFAKFKYFWIVDDGHHKTLNLEANTYFSQTLIIELENQDADEIRKFLLEHMVEATGESASFSQKISRRLRL